MITARPGLSILARRARVGLLAGLAMLCLGAGSAAAHAEFRGSTPAADALLPAMPAEVVLRFSEEIGLLGLDWILPDGRHLPAEAGAEGTTILARPPEAAGDGTQVLAWRVVSADGHPVSGALVFSVGRITGAADPRVDTSGARGVILLRSAMVAALVLSVGVAVFARLVAPVADRVAGLAVIVAMTVPLSALLLVAAEGGERLGLPVTGLATPAALVASLSSPVVRTAALSVLAAVLAALALRTGRHGYALPAWVLAALSFPASGHALTAGGWIAPVLTFAHAAAFILWVGGLVPLALAMTGQARAAPLARFSAVALPAVVVLTGSGAGLILLRTGVPGWLDTDWARLLATKLLLVALMLALAFWHRFGAMPRLARGDDPALARSIGFEAALGLAVLILAMGFRLAPPPSSAPVLPEPLHLHGAEAMADLVPAARPPGPVTFDLTLADAGFAPLDPLEVTLAFTDTAAGIGPLTARAERIGPGLWRSQALTLPTAGPWDLRLILLVTDFQQTVLTGHWPEEVAR